jgi:hypothetical protein
MKFHGKIRKSPSAAGETMLGQSTRGQFEELTNMRDYSANAAR